MYLFLKCKLPQKFLRYKKIKKSKHYYFCFLKTTCCSLYKSIMKLLTVTAVGIVIVYLATFGTPAIMSRFQIGMGQLESHDFEKFLYLADFKLI